MHLAEQHKRDRLSSKITAEGREMVPCTRCARSNEPCILAPKSKRCAACVKAGRSCDCTGVPLSAWKSVENALERLEKEEKEVEREMERIHEAASKNFARLCRIRKLKKFQKDREGELMERDALTLDEIDAATAGYNDLPPAVSSPNAPLSPSLWNSLNLEFDAQTFEPGPSN